MRYSYNASTKDLLTKLEILIANASFTYGWEYLGVVERLGNSFVCFQCLKFKSNILFLKIGPNPIDR
jgi:dynein heavy chain 1